MRRQHRLASSRSFDYLYKHGAVYKNALLVLYVAKSRITEPKVGFSVGKKVGGSVQRNRTKRRLREAFDKELPRVEKGYNYVIVARTGTADRTYDELKEATISLLRQAKKLAPLEEN